MLKDKPWKAVYRSESDNLLEDFYVPALKEAISYDRAVGFFSASMLSYAAQGVSALVEGGGKMRLVFGGEIDEDDAAAITDGYVLRKVSERVGRVVLQTVDNLAEALATQRLVALSWLVAQGHLDIKIALKRRGMYHEKIGIFRDESGDSLVFQGSANETTFALLPDFNFESINVFQTWRPELADHYQPYIDGFERLWLNETLNTHVIPFPDAARDRLVKIATRQSRPPTPHIELDIWRRLTESRLNENTEGESLPKIPATYKGMPFTLAEHQRDALNAWKSRDFHGILAMATGAGKTVTAIFGAVKLFEKTRRLFVLVAVPYQALGDQWIEELAVFGIAAIPCYQSVKIWGERLSNVVTQFQSSARQFAACVVVNKTLSSEAFQQRLNRVPGDALVIIGDECHHHAAAGIRISLPEHARFRLGLSATPKHYFDDERTASLVKYYGEIAFEFSLERALNEGVLTPYQYHVHLVDLTEDESVSYLDISARIARLAGGVDLEDSESLGSDELKLLLFKRARLLGNAANKLSHLEGLLNNTTPSLFHLFYCGDGIDDENDDDTLSRQVDKVSRMLYEHQWRVSQFTARETASERRSILSKFRAGVLDGLVAIRCLDEGVDVPDCRVAYILASSRNPKQFIQRRGRILRRAPNKERAIVHDFLVMLPDHTSGGDMGPLRKLLIGELMRVAEFGRLSENRGQVYQTLKPLLEKFDLHHHFV